MMKKLFLLCLVCCTFSAAQAQQEVLQTAQKANDYFMTKYSDPTVPTFVKRMRESNLWTRAVYYEGLMALYGIDPDKRYLDYTKRWVDHHKWMARGGVQATNADNQCCEQTYIEYHQLTGEGSLDLTRQNLDYQVGTNRILDVLKDNQVKATFFCTGNFVENAPEVMQRIMDEGHEVACHGVDHWQPKDTDFVRSKEIVERCTGRKVYGYRQPRMFPVVESEIKRAGYLYNSSLNPAFIPGRYMHLTEPRTPFMKDGVLQIPASVTPIIRFPLFWLSLHNLPEGLYHWMVRRTLKKDGHFVTYFHPWEFFDLKDHPEFKMPFIIKNHSGRQMMQRLDNLIKMLKKDGHSFITYTEFAK